MRGVVERGSLGMLPATSETTVLGCAICLVLISGNCQGRRPTKQRHDPLRVSSNGLLQEAAALPHFCWSIPSANFAFVGSRKWFSESPAVIFTPETATVVVCLLSRNAELHTQAECHSKKKEQP